MYCTNCGNQLKEGQNYCTHCGNSIQKPNNNTQNDLRNSNMTTNYPGNNNGTISLILGILSILFSSKLIPAIVLAVISIVIGKKYKQETGNNTLGSILSIIGLILSIFITIVTILYTIFMVTELINVDMDIDYSEFQENNDNYNKDDIFAEEENTQAIFDLKGYSWIGDDKSILYLNHDESYGWYQDESILDDNYYIGTYDIYVGTDAINYIANSLKEYGITQADQQKIIENSNYSLTEYYLIILNCSTAKINGVEQTPTNPQIYYYGFYDRSKQYLDLTNIITQYQAGLTLKNKLANIDI